MNEPKASYFAFTDANCKAITISEDKMDTDTDRSSMILHKERKNPMQTSVQHFVEQP
jgi:hypothetical protein